jgi:hypothetical protein
MSIGDFELSKSGPNQPNPFCGYKESTVVENISHL